MGSQGALDYCYVGTTREALTAGRLVWYDGGGPTRWRLRRRADRGIWVGPTVYTMARSTGVARRWRLVLPGLVDPRSTIGHRTPRHHTTPGSIGDRADPYPSVWATHPPGCQSVHCHHSTGLPWLSRAPGGAVVPEAGCSDAGGHRRTGGADAPHRRLWTGSARTLPAQA